MTKKIAVATMTAMLFAAVAVGLDAQPHGRASRTIIQTASSSILGHQAVTAVHDYRGALSEARHTHPGDMVGYVLEGTVTLSRVGADRLTLHAGESFFVPAGIVHNIASAGDARLLATYVVEEGKPLSVAAQ
jgi:quercetin dioxygenase-like cupin family protein